MTVFLFIVILALVAQRIYVKMEAHTLPLRKEDFGHVNYTITEIPTTYYSVGKVSDILKEWDGRFHLYRVNPKEKFNFDFHQLNSKVRAKAFLDKCKWESTLCSPCFDSKKMVTEVSTETIFNESGYYASFAKVSDEAVKYLWDSMNLPFTANVAQLEHAFIANLKTDTITAGIHANPMTYSMGIQFIGRKTWLFWDHDVYLNDMRAIPAAPILIPRQAPGRPYPLYVYTSEPGDILFFPESYAHVVLTHSGPNVLVNYRKFFPMNLFRQPLTWIAGRMNGWLSPVIHSAGPVAGNSMQQQYVPEKKINQVAYVNMDKLCEGGLTQFDIDMLEVLKKEAAKYH